MAIGRLAHPRTAPARQGLHPWRLPAGHGRGLHPALSEARHRRLGSVPGGGRAGLRDRRHCGSSADAGPRTAPPMCCRPCSRPRAGDGAPAAARGLAQPDRAVAGGAALAGAEGPAVRELGQDRARGGAGDGLLGRPPASVRLGPAAPASATPPAWDRSAAKSSLTCRMNHLEDEVAGAGAAGAVEHDLHLGGRVVVRVHVDHGPVVDGVVIIADLAWG